MSIALVQSASGGTSPVSWNSPTTTGNLVVVAIVNRSNTDDITGVTDSQGNTYTLAVQSLNTGPNPDMYLYIYYAVNITGGSGSVTVNGTLGANTSIAIHEYSGADTSSPLDQTGTANSGGTGVTSETVTTSSAIAQADEMLFACAAWNSNTVTINSPYTTRESLKTGTTGLGTGDNISASFSLTTQSATATGSGSNRAATAIATFKAAAGGGGTPVSNTAISVDESLQGLAATAADNLEALSGLAKTGLGNIEALKALIATEISAYESLMGLSSAIAVAYESLQALAVSSSIAYEANKALSASLSTVYEALQQIIGAPSVTDDFNRADGSLGNNWSTPALTSNPCTIVGNTCGAPDSATRMSKWKRSAFSFSPDQFCEAVVDTVAGDRMALLVRAKADGVSGLDQYYAGHRHVQNGTFRYVIGKFTNGFNDTQLVIHASQVVTAGDVVRLEVKGSTLTLFVNGQQILQTTDTSVTDGDPGLLVSTSTPTGTKGWDNFYAGSLSGGQFNFESLTGLAQALAENLEALGQTVTPVSQSAITPFEARGAITKSLTQNLESIRGLATTFSSVIESVKALTSSTDSNLEALKVLNQSFISLQEARGAVTSAQAENFEALRILATTYAGVIESVRNLTSVSASDFEALKGLNNSFSSSQEALIGVLKQAISNHEAAGLLVVLASAASPMEAFGALTSSRSQFYESIKSLLSSYSSDHESLVSRSAAVQSTWESLIGVAGSSQQLLESLQGVQGSRAAVQEALAKVIIAALLCDSLEIVQQLTAETIELVQALTSESLAVEQTITADGLTVTQNITAESIEDVV